MEYSKAGLISFVGMMIDKGWINTNTGNSWKAALKKILGDVANDADVSKIDVKMELLRYNNRHPGELSPGSLKTYEQRVAIAIQHYISYKTDPQNYKAPTRTASNGKNDKPEKIKVKVKTPTATAADASTASVVSEGGKLDHEPATSKHVVGTATEMNLALPFPLRPNYLAQIVIPRDMTKDEADRLCAFVQALAQVKT